jgi:hypothetical protein
MATRVGIKPLPFYVKNYKVFLFTIFFHYYLIIGSFGRLDERGGNPLLQGVEET